MSKRRGKRRHRKRQVAETVHTAEELCVCLCGSTVSVTVDEPRALLHPLPMCELFQSMEPPDFLAHIRRAMGIPDDEPEPEVN